MAFQQAVHEVEQAHGEHGVVQGGLVPPGSKHGLRVLFRHAGGLQGELAGVAQQGLERFFNIGGVDVGQQGFEQVCAQPEGLRGL